MQLNVRLRDTMHANLWGPLRDCLLVICVSWILFQFPRTEDTSVPMTDTCSPLFYETKLISLDPLVIYIKNFTTEAERQHLLELSSAKFRPSEVYNPGETAYLDHSVRDSVYADIGKDDLVTNCIRERALDFQGRWPQTRIEKSRVQRYELNGHFTYHYDALDDSSAVQAKGNRISTFMLYLEDPTAGGGTHFPTLNVDLGRASICSIVECEDDHEGTIFRPSAGNALFWMNIHQNRSMHLDTLHAGMPVGSGVKTIMNLWLWQKWSDEV